MVLLYASHLAEVARQMNQTPDWVRQVVENPHHVNYRFLQAVLRNLKRLFPRHKCVALNSRVELLSEYMTHTYRVAPPGADPLAVFGAAPQTHASPQAQPSPSPSLATVAERLAYGAPSLLVLPAAGSAPAVPGSPAGAHARASVGPTTVVADAHAPVDLLASQDPLWRLEKVAAQFNFAASPGQSQEFAILDDEFLSIRRGTLRLHVRAYNLATSRDFDVSFPATAPSDTLALLAVNGAPLFSSRRRRARRCAKLIASAARDATAYARCGANRVTWTCVTAGRGVVQVQLVSARTAQQLEDAVPHARRGLREAGSEDVCVGDAKVSLLCPLSLARIAVPARGRSCAHAACFDAGAYIAFASQHGVWDCPVCALACPYTGLYVDDWFADLLSTAGPEDDSVVVGPDGQARMSSSETEEVLFEGWVSKQGRVVKSWRRRWFEVLGDGRLRYWTEQEGGWYKGSVRVAAQGTSVSRENDTVRLRVVGRELLFKPEDRIDEWVQTLQRVAAKGQ
eukprot:m51a1_g8481 hypothetical protein (511) ;mRNA; r:520565-522912